MQKKKTKRPTQINASCDFVFRNPNPFIIFSHYLSLLPLLEINAVT